MSHRGRHPNTIAAQRRACLRSLASSIELYVEAWSTINRLRRELDQVDEDDPRRGRLERELDEVRVEAGYIKKRIYGSERNFDAAGGSPRELLFALWRS